MHYTRGCIPPPMFHDRICTRQFLQILHMQLILIIHRYLHLQYKYENVTLSSSKKKSTYCDAVSDVAYFFKITDFFKNMSIFEIEHADFDCTWKIYISMDGFEQKLKKLLFYPLKGKNSRIFFPVKVHVKFVKKKCFFDFFRHIWKKPFQRLYIFSSTFSDTNATNILPKRKVFSWGRNSQQEIYLMIFFIA